MKRFGLHIHPTHAVGFLALVSVLTIAVSVVFLLLNLRSREMERARIEAVSLTKVFMRQTEQNLNNIDLVLRNVQERLQNPYGAQFDLSSTPTHLLLSARVSSMLHIQALSLVDTDGNVVNSSREYPSRPTPVNDRGFYKSFADATVNTGLFIGKPVRSRRDGAWNWHMSRALFSPDGKFRGVVMATIDIQEYEQLYNFVKLDFERPLSIYMADGTLVASIPHREAQIGDLAPELSKDNLTTGPSDEVRMLSHARGDGGRQGFALGRVAQFPILVSVTNDEEEALFSWRETAWPIFAGSLLICVLIIVAAGMLISEVMREEELAQELSSAHDRYHRTIDSVMDGIVAVDDAHNVLVFNPAAERMFGRSAHTVIGQPLEQLLPHRLQANHKKHVDGFVYYEGLSKTMGPHLEIVGLHANGSEFPIESTISQTVVCGQRQMTAVLRDVTERRRSEENLRALNLQLRKLSESLQSVREEERSRISRELHDELGQQLTGLKLEFSWLGKRIQEGREVTREELQAMRGQLDHALASVRRISTELRPLILDDLGFGEAVAWQTEEFGKRTGIECTLDITDAKVVTDDTIASGLFRIVQESLTNITRHAQATKVGICIIASTENLILTIQDNGKGITDADRRSAGIGLVSMRERTIALGGRFSINSIAGEGCTIEVHLPLPERALTEVLG
ncbi:MAG: PAS domain S-box protein [Burkholderiales bacterium]|nr:PAS domain S-box protein [Burkholderiales bacterium]